MTASHPGRRPAAWLFCRVIDNYGDIGVAWRLACRLAEAGFQVALWHDHPPSLAALLGRQALPPDIRVRAWRGGDAAGLAEEAAAAAPALVVEAFGCDLPEAVLTHIRRSRALWLNWEYLSAEDWAETMHGKPSLQADGTDKFFWLMGFSTESGGLLRENDYAKRRRVFLQDAAAQSALRAALGLPETHSAACRWLFFGYDSPVWAPWLAAWQAWGQAAEWWLAGHQIADSLRRSGAVPEHALRQAGNVWQAGTVRLVRVDFVPQREFDKVLWLADGVTVRGEDSFVRAQLAGKPLLWHIYPQAEMAHADKLHAFWQKMYAHSDGAAWQMPHRLLSNELNGLAALSDRQRAEAWSSLLNNLPAWRQSAEAWQRHLLAQPDAVSRLLQRWPLLPQTT
ncbi:MAG: elongation factor P maturation arginine rhamnosyltransferase EarP [Eikenella sp.]|nr:elongation factor P maturation arginine rhamnosyltransferase EarP [Eikenella sp.]